MLAFVCKTWTISLNQSINLGLINVIYRSEHLQCTIIIFINYLVDYIGGCKERSLPLHSTMVRAEQRYQGLTTSKYKL